jgi:hypothetical protein
MTDWAPHCGAAILNRPYRRVEFWQIAMTATHLLLVIPGRGGDRRVRVEWDQVAKIDLTVTPVQSASEQQQEWKEFYAAALRDQEAI